MKMNSQLAAMAAAIFILAASLLAGTDVMGASSTTTNTHMLLVTPTPVPPFKLTCGGFGEKEVVFLNKGNGPVPAGTKVAWQLPKETHLIGGSDITFPLENGTYTFRQPLNPQGQVAINVPTPAPGGGQGNPDPIIVGLVAGFLRDCTVNLWTPMVQPLKVQPINSP
jgi:hypothetical protein